MDLLKISDLKKESQTDDLKKEVYRNIQNFVYKYQPSFYKQYKGDVNDLVTDLYVAFVTPKKHRNGEVFSELDRFEYEKLGGAEWTGTDEKKLATFLKTYVTHRLIDLSRTDHSVEVRAKERSDGENDKSLTFDRLIKLSMSDEDIAETYLSPEMVSKGKVLYNKLTPEKKAAFKELYSKYSSQLDEDGNPVISSAFKRFFDKILASDFVEEVKEVIPSAEVREYKIKGKPAVKVSFDPSALDNPDYDYEDVEFVLSKFGYEPYVRRSKDWYFISK